MEKLEGLLVALKAVDDKLDALLANDELTDAQRAEHADLDGQRKALTTSIARERDRLARAAERAKMEADAAQARAEATERENQAKAAAERQKRAELVPNGRLVDADLPAAHASARDLPAGVSPLVAGVSDANRISRIPAGVKRHGMLKNFVGHKDGRTAEERAYRFGMWGLAMLSQQMPGRYRFKNAEEFVLRNYGDAVNSKDVTGTSYLIPEEFSTDIIVLRESYGVARRLLKMETMVSDTKRVPRRKTGLTAYFVSEGQPGTESQKTWDSVLLVAKEVMALTRMTAQVQADAVINFGDDLIGEIAYAFTLLEDQCTFLGDGSSTYGGIVGIGQRLLNCDGAGTASIGVISAAGNWGAVTLANMLSLIAILPQYADTDDCVFVCHRLFYYSVLEKLITAAGGTRAMELREGDRKPRPLFEGYPVEFSQVMPTAYASGAIPIYFGNFQLGAMFGDRQMDSVAFSEHATIGSQNVFERNEIAVRGIERLDINVHDVGTATVAGPICGLKTP